MEISTIAKSISCATVAEKAGLLPGPAKKIYHGASMLRFQIRKEAWHIYREVHPVLLVQPKDQRAIAVLVAIETA